MTEHPALSTVQWTSVGDSGGRVECAVYKGHDLRVRHTGEFAVQQVSIGFVDGRYIGSRSNMPQICELLFAEVDKLKS